MIALGYAVKPKAAAIAGLAVLLLQAPSVITAIARFAGAASERNFAEHYDAPLVFPLKSIIAQAEQQYGPPRNATIWANQPDDTVKPVPGINVEFGPLGQLVCECSSEHPYVLALFVRYANLSARFANAPPSKDEAFAPPLPRDRIWRQNKADGPMCIVKLERSCRHVIERKEGGEAIAVRGIR